MAQNPQHWPNERKRILGTIEPLESLDSMAWYYRRVRDGVRHLCGVKKYQDSACLVRVSSSEMRRLRRYINTDLHGYRVEFYMQRRQWAVDPKSAPEHLEALGVLPMGGGFCRGDPYHYDEFVLETRAEFDAILSHLVAINRLVGYLHYCTTELPFATFTKIAKGEILHVASQLDRVMTALMVATHLQPRAEWQADLLSFLVSRRADCQRFLETVPKYYQTHRLRLVTEDEDALKGQPVLDVAAAPTCLPWCAGVYLDFLNALSGIAQHSLAIVNWCIRLYSHWYRVPPRFASLVSPASSI